MTEARGPTPTPWQQSRFRRAAGVWLFIAALVATFVLLSMRGLASDQAPTLGLISSLSVLVPAAIGPVLYLLGAFGWGRVVVRAMRLRGGFSPVGMQLALGLGFMLFLSHSLGVLGLLGESYGITVPRIVGWTSVGIGLAALLGQVARGEFRPERWPVVPLSCWAWAPALGLTIIAACNPPGALWASEFGAYDALEYHLQLPKEWAAGAVGRVWPVDHNVYSYLPSYVESAFAHLGAMTIGSGPARDRMLLGEAHWVYSCQLLHAAIGLFGALIVVHLVRMLAVHSGATRSTATVAGLAAGGLALATPWTIVTGSLAYNDLAVVALLAGAMLAAFDRGILPVRRSVAVGCLIGLACSAKPTALFLAAPAAGVALVFSLPRNRLLLGVAAGAVGGVAVMLPWLIRNAVASGGNPIFPLGASWFGAGHWSQEQVARYAAAHFFDGSLADRFSLLLGGRGLGNHQWAIVPLIGVAGLIVALVRRTSHISGFVLLLGSLLQVAAWLAFTHLQSRFLLPLLVPISAAFGLGAAGALEWLRARRAALDERDVPSDPPRLAAAVALLIPLSITGWSTVNFLDQLSGAPNRFLVVGAGGLSGLIRENAFLDLSAAEQERYLREIAAPVEYFNLTARRRTEGASADASPDSKPEGRTYLLGDATALYYLGAMGGLDAMGGGPDESPDGVVYHTPWDRSPLGDAIRAHPDEPAKWSAFLTERGFTLVLVNYGELIRLIEKNKYFDPDVTSERIRIWLTDPRAGLKSIRVWESTVPASGGAGGGAMRYRQYELFRIGRSSGAPVGAEGSPPR